MKKTIDKNIKKSIYSLCLLFIATTTLASHAVLLVSLGMPDNVLKAYFKQAKQYHIPVVIRGFYTNKQNASVDRSLGSFADTAKRVKALLQDNERGGLSINPLLFRAFGIKVVPALVIYDDLDDCIKATAHAPHKTCSKDRFDVLYGNLPIKKQLKIIASKSNHPRRSEYANSLLLKYIPKGATQ